MERISIQYICDRNVWRRSCILDSRGYIFEFSDDEEAVYGCSKWPTCHECESFIVVVAPDRRDMSRFDDHFFFHDIREFCLVKVDDDFISSNELIEQCKYIFVVSFCPRIVRAMAKDKTVSFLSWISRAGVFYDTIFELFHKYLLPFSRIVRVMMLNIHKRYIFPDFWNDDTVFVGGNIH